MDWGVSGVVLIAESHISIHTFAEKGYFSMDIFSCKDFDVEAAKEYVLSYFSASSCEVNILERGKEFPKDIRKSLRLVNKERVKAKMRSGVSV
jgi:S-adenosylmethionine decarboxylase